MERQYILWKTSRGCLTALVTFPLALVLSIGALVLLHERPWLQLSAVVILCWPLLLLPFRLDRHRPSKNGSV